MSKKKTSTKDYSEPTSYFPDLYNWPTEWTSDQDELKTGKEILRIFAAFTQSLIEDKFAVKTIKNHMGNLKLLGEEIFGRGNDEDLKLPAKKLLLEYIGEDGGPYIPSWDASDRSENGFDSTCKKLFKFISRPI